MASETAPYLPSDVADADIEFGARALDLLPPYGEIPPEFKGVPGGPWVEFVDRWFFEGVRADVLRARPGIDRTKALRHLKLVMGSWEPRHEHKIAGVAYLLSLWFEPLAAPTPTRREREAASAPAAHPARTHTCHATGCITPVPPAMLMCRTHWSKVPKPLKDRVWATYRKGQEVRKDASPEYLAAARAAIAAVAAKEVRRP